MSCTNDEGIPLLTRGEGESKSSARDPSKLTRPGAPRSNIAFHRQSSSSALFGVAEVSTIVLDPIAALSPLMSGGEKKVHRADPTIKSVPAFAPYERNERNRSESLIFINEFRHWWKVSRLLVRLAGLWVRTQDDFMWDKMVGIKIWKKKGPKKALKHIKRLGQGGPMRLFLKYVQPFTRAVRIVVASWRYFEASKCRRAEVGLEEFMAFMGNRVSRYLARYMLDNFALYMVIPVVQQLIENGYVGKYDWHPASVFIVLGVIRAVAPFAASFQGSRFGRVLTRATFNTAQDRWTTIMRVNDINLSSDDCCEGDEVLPTDPNFDLVVLARKVAMALGKDSSNPEPSPHRAMRYMSESNFGLIGCGSGGYTVYSYRDENRIVLVHVTPYGPAVFDELPRYIVLEREASVDTRGYWSDYLRSFTFKGPPLVEGYCYKGAFFSPYQFAALRARYDEELLAYSNACKLMCTAAKGALPPTDLASLKAFVEMGRSHNTITKRRAREKQLQALADKLKEKIQGLMDRWDGVGSKAPAGVILYFDGLDCAGKSSSGRFVTQALERAGYKVEQRRYNTPPTAEDLKRPWMARFDKPNLDEEDDTIERGYGSLERAGDLQPAFRALVWDRGPAGDFVFGTLANAPEVVKRQRYREFMEFDAKCRDDGIFFCKLMFVVDRDSVARTLGKRLAHKVIVKDLHNWLDSSSGSEGEEVCRAGLAEIDNHIDETDFIAFNSYRDNLHKFIDFAKNTDASDTTTWFNPWLVVSTTDRHSARFQLLVMFGKQLDRFAMRLHNVATVLSWLGNFLGVDHNQDAADVELLQVQAEVEQELTSFRHNIRLKVRTLVLIMGLLFIIFVYLEFKLDTD